MSKEELQTQLPELLPIDFFSIECTIEKNQEMFHKKMEKHFLPQTSELLNEQAFANLALLWDEEGIYGQLQVDEAFAESLYPEYREGDSLELFFDTRNIKTAGFATKFCHHFLLLPVEVNGIHAKELTRFRSEDSHPLAETLDAKIETEFLKKGYIMRFFLSKNCFYGYEPLSSSSLGFTYRINRAGKNAQHFSVSSLYYSIEQQPSLWATIHLKSGSS